MPGSWESPRDFLKAIADTDEHFLLQRARTGAVVEVELEPAHAGESLQLFRHAQLDACAQVGEIVGRAESQNVGRVVRLSGNRETAVGINEEADLGADADGH